MASSKFTMIVRNLSTTNAAHQLVKPPIQLFGIEGRYATALFSAASKEKKLEAVEKELVKFQDTLKTDTKLREFILNPTIQRNIKSTGLKQVSEKVSLSSASSNLLQLLAENGRLKKLNAVINAYKNIMSAYRGEVQCEVTTAKPLEQAQRQKLESVLKSFLKSNETIYLTAKVDPSIIGGMIVSIGDRYVDMSVSNKIKKYTEILSSPI
ncbi:atp synthase delta chain [Holotrichia oblita]|uniref:Atp synthase delta chain n=1 Tax=Holotrichia oblita TaxID=644536 RepID=A0ACB9STR4_HOLOL|nr:atp synthase delta chain [Holotrichia oblita]